MIGFDEKFLTANECLLNKPSVLLARFIRFQLRLAIDVTYTTGYKLGLAYDLSMKQNSNSIYVGKAI